MNESNINQFQWLLGESIASDAAPLPGTALLWHQLQGIGIDVDRDAEPYMLLAEFALQEHASRPLAELVAIALTEVGPNDPKLHQRERALYNLVHLCTELRNDPVLGEGVWRLYHQRIPKGYYKGAALVDPLRGAMIYNQPVNPDRDTLPFWLRMIQGHEDEFVGGRKVDGFRGAIRSMTIRRLEKEGRLTKLGEVLRLLYQHSYDLDRHGRATLLRRELEHLLQTYPMLRHDAVLDAANLALEFTSVAAIQRRFRERWPMESNDMEFLREFTRCKPGNETDTAALLNRAYTQGMALLSVKRENTSSLLDILSELRRLLPHGGGPISLKDSQIKLAAYAACAHISGESRPY